MPIVQFHIAENAYSEAQISELLLGSSCLYAEILRSPIERVRAFAQLYLPSHLAVGGQLVSAGATPAPYFHFLVLEGRPVEECHQLIRAFTDLVVDVLKCDRADVRGGCWPIPPQYWGIAGEPASAARAAEIAARANVANPV